MSLNAAVQWEVRTTGSADTNGGGFKAGASGTDYSQQDNPNTVGSNIGTTDVVAAGTTTITSAAASFTSAIVGNVIYLQGGTGSLAAGWYEVASCTNATTVVVDRTVATGTGITLVIGGCFASLGGCGKAGPVAANKVWVKTGAYTITSASTNVAGGCYTNASATVEGYQTTRGDLGTRPVFTASGITNFTLIASTGANATFRNLSVDGASATGSRGFSLANPTWAFQLHAANCKNYGILGGSQTVCVRCTATGCATVEAIRVGVAFECEAYANTAPGFSFAGGSGGMHVNCLSYANIGASADGWGDNGNSNTFINCVAYGNGRHGFNQTGQNPTYLNCLAEGNGVSTTPAYGWVTGSALTKLLHCGAYNNASGNVQAGASDLTQSFVTGTATFFTNAGAGDFSLNTTAGGGAAARAVGLPGTFPRGLTVGYADLGAAQHNDPVTVVGGISRARVQRGM
jgi:hypothetical protein